MIFNKDFSYGFNENACQECGGKCCTGESGNIFANKEELKALREHLQLDEKEIALFMIFVRSNAAPFLFGNILKHIKRS